MWLAGWLQAQDLGSQLRSQAGGIAGCIQSRVGQRGAVGLQSQWVGQRDGQATQLSHAPPLCAGRRQSKT